MANIVSVGDQENLGQNVQIKLLDSAFSSHNSSFDTSNGTASSWKSGTTVIATSIFDTKIIGNPIVPFISLSNTT